MAFVACKTKPGFANVDEFHEINLARYCTSQEAMMAIYAAPLVKLSHPVIINYIVLYLILYLIHISGPPPLCFGCRQSCLYL